MTYREAIRNEMKQLSHEGYCFIGQQVRDQDFYGTLKGVPLNKRIEFPVAEELQMGASIGMSMNKIKVVSIYQRIDFLMRAMDQLVNHLNLIEKLTNNRYNGSGIIIRTTIGSKIPMNAGCQHTQDLSAILKKSVNIQIVELQLNKQMIKSAFKINTPIITIERQEWYDRKI